MNLNFNKNGVAHTPLNKWELSDGSFLVIYQGSRGDNPELDFIIKYKSTKIKSRLRAPSHTHWIVDLIIKSEYSPSDISNYIKEWIEINDDLIVENLFKRPKSSITSTTNKKTSQNESFEVRIKNYLLEFINKR